MTFPEDEGMSGQRKALYEAVYAPGNAAQRQLAANALASIAIQEDRTEDVGVIWKKQREGRRTPRSCAYSLNRKRERTTRRWRRFKSSFTAPYRKLCKC